MGWAKTTPSGGNRRARAAVIMEGDRLRVGRPVQPVPDPIMTPTLMTTFLLALAGPGALASGPPGEGRPPAPAAVGRKAPPLTSDTWLNRAPLSPADLRGKVVLVEFWTFGCINCVRTIPAMQELQRALAGRDLVMVGVHTPEFPHEKRLENVRRAVARLGVRYPVAVDNDFRVWDSFGNLYWPSLYLVDRRGVIRHVHVGELHVGSTAWRELRARIEALLQEPA